MAHQGNRRTARQRILTELQGVLRTMFRQPRGHHRPGGVPTADPQGRSRDRRVRPPMLASDPGPLQIPTRAVWTRLRRREDPREVRRTTYRSRSECVNLSPRVGSALTVDTAWGTAQETEVLPVTPAEWAPPGGIPCRRAAGRRRPAGGGRDARAETAPGHRMGRLLG